ncbi:hypothetical protein D9611_008465 [Ephemerocybe angulata]|uniref:Uncharacterized protein n=1 Tax=Ephemerocybe angulata TaxID=980116 RepID=A0A8H5B0G7_9AGAR|nr:hypothetical protein D9611_008465 [Tulosesus angulatus]
MSLRTLSTAAIYSLSLSSPNVFCATANGDGYDRICPTARVNPHRPASHPTTLAPSPLLVPTAPPFQIPPPPPVPLDDEVPYQPVFNILDAPSRPNEPRLFLKKSVKLPKTYSCADRQRLAKERIRDPMPPKRLTMPSPRVFDGPAQPRHAALQESQRRRPSLAPQQLQMEPWATMPSTPTTSSANGRPLSTSAPNGQAIPSSSVVKIFDGPARLSRYHHKSQEEKESYWRRRKNTTTLVMLAGGSAAFVGYAVTSWS